MPTIINTSEFFQDDRWSLTRVSKSETVYPWLMTWFSPAHCSSAEIFDNAESDGNLFIIQERTRQAGWLRQTFQCLDLKFSTSTLDVELLLNPMLFSMKTESNLGAFLSFCPSETAIKTLASTLSNTAHSRSSSVCQSLLCSSAFFPVEVPHLSEVRRHQWILSMQLCGLDLSETSQNWRRKT